MQNKLKLYLEIISVSHYFLEDVFCKPTGLLLHIVFSNIEFFMNFCEYVFLCAYAFLTHFLTFLFSLSLLVFVLSLLVSLVDCLFVLK